MKLDALKTLVIAQLEALKAQDIVVLDISKQTTIADLFVIVGGTSKRHRQAIADRVIEVSKLNNIKILGCEGYDTAEWILIDLGDIVLHVMQQQTRSRYDLEGLWQDTEIGKQTTHADTY
ncbi:MAG: ribosome silencing factor [Chromatiales bacterium]|nr:ribosome silencing factor [Chromatiales bacterium]